MSAEPTLMHQMASLQDAKLADVHMKIEDIQTSLDKQAIKMDKILAFLLVLEHHVVTGNAAPEAAAR